MRLSRKFKKSILTIITACAGSLLLGSSLYAAAIVTDDVQYIANLDVAIDGSTFGFKEAVTLQVSYLDGSVLAGASGDAWIVEATPQGDFLTTWMAPIMDTASVMLLTAVGNVSGDSASSTFMIKPPKANLDQLRNGGSGSPNNPGDWVNGNLGSANSHYIEEWSAAYRTIMTDMPVGDTVTLTLEYDIKRSDKHAIDYLTHYDRIDDPGGSHLSIYGHAQETIDPTDGVTGIVDGSLPFDVASIPLPTVSILVAGFPQPTTSFNSQIATDREMSLWGGTFLGLTPISYPTPGAGESDLGAATSATRIDVSFIVDSSTMILAWGGHIASRNDWGDTLSAGGISGSPYHMRLNDWTINNLGGQDRSLSAGTISPPTFPACSLSVSVLDACVGDDNCIKAFANSGSAPYSYSWAGPGGFSSSIDSICLTNIQSADAGDYVVTVTDSLGLTSVCSLLVSVNQGPVSTCPSGPINMFVCDLSDICIPGFTSFDAEGDGITQTIIGGSISDDTVCFTPVAGANVIQFISSNACGADTCSVTVNVTLNSPPVASCPANDNLFVCDLSDICLPGFSGSDVDGNIVSVSVDNGTISNDTVCFTPVPGVNTITSIVTDACGAADTCVTTITVTVNVAPVATSPASSALFVCDLSDICLAGFSGADSDGNLSSVAVSGGTLSNDTVCFTPVEGANVLTIVSTDACGLADTSVTTVTITLNSPPVTAAPADDTMFVCDMSDICLSGFSVVDANSNLASVSVTGGTLSGDTVCFTPSMGDNVITLIATDSCGVADTSETTITVAINSGPVVSCPSSSALFVCDLSDICLPGFSAVDGDGNLLSVAVDNGSLSGDTVCFTPIEGANTITLIATDSCGAADTCVTTITVTVNVAPVATSPASSALFVCDLSDICLAGFSGADSDGNLSSVTVSGGTLSNDTVCFTPISGANVLTVIATDACGLADTSITTVTITVNSAPVVTAPNDTSVFLCNVGDTVCTPPWPEVDIDDNKTGWAINMGWGFADGICFVPDTAGVYLLECCAIDSCGATGCDTMYVTVSFNSPPVASSPANDTLFVCDMSDICLASFGATDADGNLSDLSVTGGVLSNDTVCFTPVMGENVITLIATDSCGAADTTTTIITVDINNPPTATCPGNQAMFVCDLSDICLPGFVGADSDGNLVSVAVDNGALSNDTVCFTPVPGVNTITLIATDACGAADTCVTKITITVNSAPICASPADLAMFVCDLSEICIDGFSCTDVDGNLSSSTVSNGTLTAGTVCFTPVEGANEIILTCTDACSAQSSCTTTVTVTLNSAPTVSCANDTAVALCNAAEICVGPFTASDVDGNLASSTASFGTFAGGNVCFTPDTAGVYSIIWTATDSCGAGASCTTNVTVDLAPDPVIADQEFDVALCDTATVCYALPTVSGGTAPFTFTSDGVATSDSCCVFLDINTTAVVEIIVTDACGKVDTASLTVNATVNSAPAVSISASSSTFTCNPGDTVCTKFSVIDPDNGLSGISNLGWVDMSDSTVCFIVGDTSGVYCDQITISDSCGLTDVDNYCVTVTLNTAPVASCVGDQTFEGVCTSNVCIEPFECSDVDGNLASRSLSFGEFITEGGIERVCFAADTSGIYTIQLICVDSCGAADTCSSEITVTLNQAPTVSCPNDVASVLCAAGEQVCVSGFSSSDADGAINSSSVSFGTLTGNQVCFAADTAGVYEIVYTAMDDCGASSSCTTLVTVDFHESPSLPQDAAISGGFFCTGGQVCIDRPSATGGNAPYAYSVSGNCQIVNNQICLNLVPGSNSVKCTLTVVDDCGNSDEQVLTYNADVNLPPVANCPSTFSVRVCDTAALVCVPGFSVFDPDGNLQNVTVNVGTLNGSSVCFTPGAPGNYDIIVTATDSCGAMVTCTTAVEVNADDCDVCPIITLEKAHNTLQGERVCLSITSEGSARPFGGFDFLVSYDNSVLVALGATEGTFIEGCGWEYFTYRFGANGNCNSGCPSGLIRIVAIADINDGMSHPLCFGPGTSDPVELAEICFQVTNDRSMECQYAPVRFFWMDCGDNSLSDQTGDTLFVSGDVFDFGNPNPINDPSAGFPTYLGTQPECLVGSGFPGKPTPIPCLTFQNGGVDIICADSIDGRGDINLNGLDNEIADAVMFTEYFVSGLSAFDPHEAGSIAASEVNGDGIPLSVADLVYLIRVIVGDAMPLAKLPHDAKPVSLSNIDGVISSEIRLGAALFVFEGVADVTLLQSHMNLTVGMREGNTYALVSPDLNTLSAITDGIDAGDIIASSGVLLSASASDVEGTLVEVSVSSALPSSFALKQNYPNPFNPSTKIDFTLPSPMAYNVSIYNVAGQKVAEFNGAGNGAVTVIWEASEVSSGLYFYKLTAGDNIATKKMVLLK